MWRLAQRQHGVVSRSQLLDIGLSPKAIKHRVARGRLHPAFRGTYAVGRPRLTRDGVWMAAVLCCGPGAALSHDDDAALLGIRPLQHGHVHVTVQSHVRRRAKGVVVHRRAGLVPPHVTQVRGIPVTSVVVTLVDLATSLDDRQLHAAVSEADTLGLIDPEGLRAALAEIGPTAGVGALRELLDRSTFALTDSELERRFLPLARAAGLPRPQTRRRVNGYRVDFYWPALGLVVETDGLRYHRTPGQQTRDRRRDQVHAAAGLTPLRFTHSDVRYEPGHVEATLAAVAARLRGTS